LVRWNSIRRAIVEKYQPSGDASIHALPPHG
jgi:hypothetical protein